MKFKQIDKKQVLYHYFKIDEGIYSLFDDEMDYPVVYGSKNLVEATVKNLRKDAYVLFYKKNNKNVYEEDKQKNFLFKSQYDKNKKTSQESDV